MTNPIDGRLRVAAGFRADERDRVRQVLAGKLARRLSRWPADAIEVEVSIKDRDTDQQQVTLEVWIASKGRSRFVATSDGPDLWQALNEVRDDVHRQVDRFVTKHETRTRS